MRIALPVAVGVTRVGRVNPAKKYHSVGVSLQVYIYIYIYKRKFHVTSKILIGYLYHKSYCGMAFSRNIFR